MAWTHPICADCWYTENPGRDAFTIVGPVSEQCCICGEQTYSGIYVRRDPATVRYPARDDE